MSRFPMTSGSQRFLTIYSGVLTAVFAVTVLSGFVDAPKKLSVEQLDVQRINLREPDGTLRLVVSNTDKAPGIYIKNKEYPHPSRKTAGMIFLNDEGTENGGLIFGGEKSADGTKQSYGHLSFDAYEQDQTLTLDASQEGDAHSNRITLIDQPPFPILELIQLLEQIKNLPPEEQTRRIEAFYASHGGKPKTRMSMGRGQDGTVGLGMMDAQGRPRLLLMVAADGTPKVQTLDENGKVTGELPVAAAH
jgi:hypothetical protein